MDLRAYYAKIREAEAQLIGTEFVVVSMATPEGGKAGVKTETPRFVAARMMAEGCARLATKEEASEFRAAARTAKDRCEQEEAARRVQVVVLPHSELRGQKDKDRS